MRSQRLVATAIALIMIVILAVAALAAPFPERLPDLRLRSEPLAPSGGSALPDGRPVTLSMQRVFVQLRGPSLAAAWSNNRSLPSQQRLAVVAEREVALAAEQAQAAARVQLLGGRVLATYDNVFNGLAVEIDAAALASLAREPGIVGIQPVVDYRLALDDTVPWVGAAEVQTAGFDGGGIRVAVADTGIDYTHAHLGGSGLQADTDEAIAGASLPADPTLFPSAKVIGGYDFVGSSWDGNTVTLLAPDPNPMDDNGGLPGGHGTHVASIIGGLDRSASGGAGPGVAPGVSLYALKVCSSVASSCSGIAIRQAFDWAADPNGDKDFGDRADVLNLSIGASYGQTGDQDLAIIDQLSELGMIVVAAAGNNGDDPYVVNSPSNAASAISVAQTTMPGTDDALVLSSARGPAFDTQALKPELGAPGASRSASSGNQGYESFSGTSGATPMVAGAAALLLDANGGPGSLDWVAAKALLMNNALHEVQEAGPGEALAPISRQGAGRLDVAAAVQSGAYAYVVDDQQAALAFGMVPVSAPYQATRRVRVVNQLAQPKTFAISADLRYESDEALGVIVSPSTNEINVPAGDSVDFMVTLSATDPLLLPDYFNLLGGGENLNNGQRLTMAEVDGFVTMQSGEETLRVPFHFLPRQAANMALSEETLPVPPAPQVATVTINNAASVSGIVESYPLFDVSPPLDAAVAALLDEQPVDLHFVGSDVIVDPFDGDDDYDDHNVYLFALTTYETRSHPVNVRYLVYVDLDGDGQDDWIVYNIVDNLDRWISAQYDVADDSVSPPYFPLDTALNSNTMVLYLLLPQGADPDLIYDFRVEAYDAYFGTPSGAIRLWDESPIDGGYHRHDYNNPAFITDTYYAELGEQESVQPQFQAKLSQSTQIGYLFRFPNGEQEALAVPMQPTSFYRLQLPLVVAHE